jgi:hypothetical protein
MTDKNQLTADEQKTVDSTRRFDLRRILGALFVVYGVIVFVTGFFTIGGSELKMTGGIAINFWTGGAMFVVGLLFFLWDRLAPVPAEDILHSEDLAEQEREEEKTEGLVSE